MTAARTAVPLGLFIGCLIVVGIALLATPQMHIPGNLLEPQAVQAGSDVKEGESEIPLMALPVESTSPFEESETPAAEHSCSVSPTYPAAILRWCDLITHYADENGLEPDLVAAVMLQESGGDPTAYSQSGAVGLMQVMPRDGLAAGFMCVNGPCFASRPTILELEDPDFNLSYSTRMLAALLHNWGTLREALKHYGPMDVGYHYADLVLSIYQRYR